MWTTLVVFIGSGEHVYVSTPYICITLIFSSRAISECQVGLPAVTMICWLLLPTSSSMNMWTTLVVSPGSGEHGDVSIPHICIALIFSSRVIFGWWVGVPAATMIYWLLSPVQIYRQLWWCPLWGSGEHGYVPISCICIALIFSSRAVSGLQVGLPAVAMTYWPLTTSVNMWTTLMVFIGSGKQAHFFIPCICSIALIFSSKVISGWQVMSSQWLLATW